MFNKIAILFLLQIIKSLLCKNNSGEITVFTTSSYPNLTLHCIDNNQESESALIWLNGQNKEELANDLKMPKKYVWEMANNNGFIDENKFFEDVKLENSLDFGLNYTGFVLDRRWNDFKEIRTEGNEFHHLISIPSQNDVFTIDFSLRIKEDAYVYISDHIDPLKAENSYFLIFGGWWNNSIGLRRCVKGEINENVHRYPKGNCFPVKVFGKAGTFPTASISEWNHFRIEKQFNTVNLYQYLDHSLKRLLTFHETNIFLPTRAMVRSRVLGYWKIHDYKFYAITKNRIQSKEFFVSSEHLCIKVYFKTCPKCSVRLEIWNLKNKIVSKNATQAGINWETIILRSEEKVQNLSLKLVIEADIRNKSEPYLIGDIIDCSQDKTHQIQTNQIDKMLQTCCHSIKHAVKVCPRYSIWCDARNITSIDSNKRCPEKTFRNNCFSCDAFNNCKFCEMYCEKSTIGDLECRCYDYNRERNNQDILIDDTWNEIEIISFVQKNRLLNVSFSVNCNEGPITISINVTCISPWCFNLPLYQQHHTVEKKYKTTSINEHISFDVIGLTEYKIKISAKSYSAKFTPKEYTLTTNATSSGPVLDANIYNKTKISLSIRFKPPYPKMGNLDLYKVYFKQHSTNIEHIHLLLPSRCKLWVDYHCVELNNLQENVKYIINVVPINNQDLRGESTVITGITTEQEPDPPEFLLLTWMNNYQFLRVEFPHPIKTNGPLKSYTLFIDNEMLLKTIINNEEKSYIFDILKWEPESNITIGVKVENQGGQSNIVQNSTSTPPSIPQINTTTINIKANVTNIHLNIPGIEVNEHVKCFMAVIVTKLSTQSQLNPDFFTLTDQKILEEIQAPQNYMSWVAWKNNIIKNKPITISIGDDTGNNRVLLENTKYKITIYIKNTYNNKTSIFTWFKEETTLLTDCFCYPCDPC